MLQFLWDTRGYFFWLLVVSALCLIAERIRPWRSSQGLFRRQFLQDLCWLFFNGHYAGILVGHAGAFLFGWAVPAIERLQSFGVLDGLPIWVRFLSYFVIKDFCEWAIHNLLHRVPWLWQFHKVHHSIEQLDWIGNFRFHWMEIVVYQGLTYLPLIVLGADGSIILAIAILSTLIGHLNHSNLDISWGPLRYVINSPRMHVWHHDRDWPVDRRYGVNFAICLSIWDWIFGTAYWPSREASPEQQPRRLGFHGMDRFPRSLLDRILYPLSSIWQRRHPGPSTRRASQT